MLAARLTTAHTWEVADLGEAVDCRQQHPLGQSAVFWRQTNNWIFLVDIPFGRRRIWRRR